MPLLLLGDGALHLLEIADADSLSCLASQTLTINGKTPLATKDGKLPSLLPRSNLFGPVLVPAGAAAFVEVETA